MSRQTQPLAHDKLRLQAEDRHLISSRLLPGNGAMLTYCPIGGKHNNKGVKTMIFKSRRKHKAETAAELRFNRVMDLVKDLDQEEYKRLKQAMDQAYKAYQTIRGIEGEDDDIQDAEAILSEEDN